MRSFDEISFRARQEAANFYLYLSKPQFKGEAPQRLDLPEVETIVAALQNSAFASSVISTADQIIRHKFPILGVTLDTGEAIQWRRDYIHERDSAADYFRRVPYLEFAAVGDHKFVWELNRHQHLVLLAQAHAFTRNQVYRDEVFSQLSSWFEQNPFQQGINWASALEVAFRALSWVWVYHLLGAQMPEAFRREFLTGLYQHALHLSENLSVYFSPNTHLLGEAVALFAVSTLFPAFDRSGKWRRRSSEIVSAQLQFQVQSDGSHFEQSTYYHVYALDFFLQFYLLAGRPAGFEPVLHHMADYLFWLLGPSRRISFFGDDDGGRLFHPYGSRNEFGRATLATCGVLFDREDWKGTSDDLSQQAVWWIGSDVLSHAAPKAAVPSGNRLFERSGSIFLQSTGLWLQMDCGPFGYGGAGHSHSDTLSFVLEQPDAKLLIDPGTYTYISDLQLRNWFRGSSGHNTVAVDGLNQASPQGPFRWGSKPDVSLNRWRSTATGGAVDCTCRYSGFTHRRRLLLDGNSVVVLDEMDGPQGDHLCEQHWHRGRSEGSLQINSSALAETREVFFSEAYGSRSPGSVIVIKQAGPFPIRLATVIHSERREVGVDETTRILDRVLSETES